MSLETRDQAKRRRKRWAEYMLEGWWDDDEVAIMDDDEKRRWGEARKYLEAITQAVETAFQLPGVVLTKDGCGRLCDSHQLPCTLWPGHAPKFACICAVAAGTVDQ